MNRNLFFAALLTWVVFSSPTWADDKEDNEPKKHCKLTVRTTLKSGKKKIDVLVVPAVSREDCRLQAKEKEKVADPEVAKVTASFGYR